MRTISSVLIVFSVAVILFIFGPVIKEEIVYSINRMSKIQYRIGGEASTSAERILTPPNEDFSILVPKIGAAAPVIADVDSQNPKKYLAALRKGVAHAAGTSYPGEGGNTYLFAHSTDAFYNVSQYNAIFYLIGKLNSGDRIGIYYNGKLIEYEVYEKKVVSADAIEYLGKIDDGETLTLQTCYPPGTTLKRLVVLAKRVTS